jgi:hypothetical protein
VKRVAHDEQILREVNLPCQRQFEIQFEILVQVTYMEAKTKA